MTKKWSRSDVRECIREMGLDPFEVDFHIVPANVLYDLAARALPGRYSHWSHGKSFHEGITRHDYRFGRIYELVFNTDPCQAFLLDVNSEIINLLVQAHVYGHSDFFKMNREFSGTDRGMNLNAAMRAERIRKYEEEYGEDEVREAIDDILAVEFYAEHDRYDARIKEKSTNERKPGEFDDLLKKPEVFVKDPSYDEKVRFSGLPTMDVLGFLMAEAPVEDWKRDLISIVREDGLYFMPQIKTKIINEGWASFIHQKVMRQLDIGDHEYFEYAETNAGVVSAGQVSLNPYWLGVQIFKDVEKRLGWEEALRARRMETNSGFLRNYLTKELIEELDLLHYRETERHYVVGDTEWERIRNHLIEEVTDRMPSILVVDKNYKKEGALLIKHNYYGRSLEKEDAIMVLRHLKNLWKRKVYLETVIWENGKVEVWSSEDKVKGE